MLEILGPGRDSDPTLNRRSLSSSSLSFYHHDQARRSENERSIPFLNTQEPSCCNEDVCWTDFNSSVRDSLQVSLNGSSCERSDSFVFHVFSFLNLSIRLYISETLLTVWCCHGVEALTWNKGTSIRKSEMKHPAISTFCRPLKQSLSIFPW